MIGHIETACFHYSGGGEMIFASNRDRRKKMHR